METNEMGHYVYVDGELAVKTTDSRGRNAYEILPAQEVNWTKTARKFSERRDYRRQYLAQRANNTLTVTAGRGSLTDMEWSSLKGAVYNAVYALAGDNQFLEESYGKGRWNGFREENYSVVFRKPYTVPAKDLEELKLGLGRIADQHHQDAIGLVIGTSELIYG